MAEVLPLRALHYDLRVVGSLDAVAAPPYDVIDPSMRAELAARSPFNVVEVDLPEAPGGGDRYLHAQTTFEAWRQQGVVVQDREPALWPATQEYDTPDGERRVRRGFLCRVRVEDYGPGRIRPHERTQPGPKEDRLRLTRATRANLSPIFSLFPDPEGAAWAALEPASAANVPFGSATDAEGTTTTIWRCADEAVIATVRDLLADRELLIAYRRLDTALLEALILKEALGMSEDDIARQAGVAYAKRAADAVAAVESGSAEAAFLLRATPVEQVRAVAEAGESMPPKSTFFHPKVPTGLLFNPLE